MFFNLLMAKSKKKQKDYIELEYLESTGTQYLNLNHIPTAETGAHIKVSTVDQDDMIICGSRNDANNTRLFLSSTYSNKVSDSVPSISIGRGTYIYLRTDSSFNSTSPIVYVPLNTVYEQYTNYKNSKVVRFIDPTRDITSVTIPELTFTPNQPLYLFAGNVAGVARYNYKGKIYSCEITEGDKLVMDLIPVLNKNLVPCMYDKVSGKYFYNQGDGEFKWKLPNQLEYLESVDNQYIDTLLPVTSKTGALIDAEWVYESTYFSTLAGSYQSFMPLAIVPSSERICYSYNSNATGTTTYPLKDGTFVPSNQTSSVDSSKFITQSTRFQVGLNYLGSRKWTYKTAGENYENDLGNIVVQNDNTITLFGRRYSATPQEGNSYFWKGKIYSAIFTEGDKIVRYLIPVFDKTLTPCMYDLVSKKYFYNRGTGQFKGYFEDGSQVVSYLSATGTQWIDTGITPLMGDEIELKSVQCKRNSSLQTIFSAGMGAYQTILLIGNSGVDWYKYFATGGAQPINEPFNLNNPTTIRVDGEGSIYYNDTFVVQSPPVQETDSSMRLFYRVGNTSPMTGNIGAVSIKRDGEFIIDLIPVVKSDNTACMLDLISKQYLVNKGTSPFTYGTQVNLFDPTKPSYVAGYISTNNNGNITSSTLTDSFYIPCKPNTTYLVKRTAYREANQVWRVATIPTVPTTNMSIPHYVGGLINDLYLVIKSRDVDKYLLFSEGRTLHTDGLSKFTVLEIEDNNSLIV